MAHLKAHMIHYKGCMAVIALPALSWRLHPASGYARAFTHLHCRIVFSLMISHRPVIWCIDTSLNVRLTSHFHHQYSMGVITGHPRLKPCTFHSPIIVLSDQGFACLSRLAGNPIAGAVSHGERSPERLSSFQEPGLVVRRGPLRTAD